VLSASDKKLAVTNGENIFIYNLPNLESEKDSKSELNNNNNNNNYIPAELICNLGSHSDCVLALSFSYNNNFLASSGADNLIRIWSLISFNCISILIGHSHYVSSICWSLNNKYLISGSWDETAIIWNTNNWKISNILRGHINSITSVTI